MKAKDIAELLDEPACEHNKKSKSGCAKSLEIQQFHDLFS